MSADYAPGNSSMDPLRGGSRGSPRAWSSVPPGVAKPRPEIIGTEPRRRPARRQQQRDANRRRRRECLSNHGRRGACQHLPALAHRVGQHHGARFAQPPRADGQWRRRRPCASVTARGRASANQEQLPPRSPVFAVGASLAKDSCARDTGGSRRVAMKARVEGARQAARPPVMLERRAAVVSPSSPPRRPREFPPGFLARRRREAPGRGCRR